MKRRMLMSMIDELRLAAVWLHFLCDTSQHCFVFLSLLRLCSTVRFRWILSSCDYRVQSLFIATVFLMSPFRRFFPDENKTYNAFRLERVRVPYVHRSMGTRRHSHLLAAERKRMSGQWHGKIVDLLIE